jgi:ATP-dependent DNA helicase RecG
MRIDDLELEHLLTQGESFRVERKESLSGSAPTSIRQAVCAFANDLPGSGAPGVVFVGAKDCGDPVGLPVGDELLLQLADIKTDGNIVPPPSMFVEKRTLKNAELAVITVLPSDSPPVRYKGAIHVRTGPRKGHATAQDERILNEKRRYKNIPFDIQPIPGVDLSALNVRQFEDEYLRVAFTGEVLEANERSIEQRLAATKMISSADDATVTILGLLVLGKSPRDYIPGLYIQFLRIDGTELTDDIIDEDSASGTITEILRRTDEKLRGHIRTRVDIASSDTEQRMPSYPLAALQQLVRNAIMHRTYEATNAPVRVNWFNDRVEIWSPGGPYGAVTRTNFAQPGITDYRNLNLAEAMKVLGYVQRFGVGIASAMKLLGNAGHPELKFLVEDNYVQVIIRGQQKWPSLS